MEPVETVTGGAFRKSAEMQAIRISERGTGCSGRAGRGDLTGEGMGRKREVNSTLQIYAILLKNPLLRNGV